MAREAEKSAREGKQTSDDDASSSPKGKETAAARDAMTSASGGPAKEVKEPSTGSVAEFQDQRKES